MRKVATLFSVLCAVGASFALATAASAAFISIIGSPLPGTNVYSIVLTFTTAENVASYFTSVSTDGTYTGAFTETLAPGFGFAVPGPTVGVGTGVRGSWAGANVLPVAGGTFTIGTVTVTVGELVVINPVFTIADGVFDSDDALVPTTLIGVVTIPEPTTASLLGLGLVGLFMVDRRSRASGAFLASTRARSTDGS